MHNLRAFGYILGALFVVVSAAANARNGAAQGVELFDKTLYIFTAVGVDGLKVIVPLLAVACWDKGFRWWATIAVFIWCGAITLSLVGAIGWSATSRSNAHGVKANQEKDHAEAQARVNAAFLKLKALPPHRPEPIVLAAINAVAVPKYILDRTERCLKVSRAADIEVCKPLLELHTELATAKQEVKLSADVKELENALSKIKAPTSSADPPAETLARWTWSTPEQARGWLSLLIAILIEAAGALIITITHVATSRSVAGVATPPTPDVVAGVAEPIGGGAVAERAAPPPQALPPPPRGGAGGGEKVVHINALSATQSPATPYTEGPRHSPATVMVAEPRHSSRHRCVADPATAVWRTPPLDAVEVWAAHRLDVAPQDGVTTSAAYEDFCEWCAAERIEPLSGQQFGMQAQGVVRRMGGRKVKRRDARYFEGVALSAKDNT